MVLQLLYRENTGNLNARKTLLLIEVGGMLLKNEGVVLGGCLRTDRWMRLRRCRSFVLAGAGLINRNAQDNGEDWLHACAETRRKTESIHSSSAGAPCTGQESTTFFLSANREKIKQKKTEKGRVRQGVFLIMGLRDEGNRVRGAGGGGEAT